MKCGGSLLRWEDQAHHCVPGQHLLCHLKHQEICTGLDFKSPWISNTLANLYKAVVKIEG